MCENVSTNLVKINKFRTGGREREKREEKGKRGFINLEPLYTKRATHTQCTQTSLSPTKHFTNFISLSLSSLHTHILSHMQDRGAAEEDRLHTAVDAAMVPVPALHGDRAGGA